MRRRQRRTAARRRRVKWAHDQSVPKGPFADAMAAVVRTVHPHMTKAGFRKRRHAFNRSMEDGVVQVVQGPAAFAQIFVYRRSRAQPRGVVRLQADGFRHVPQRSFRLVLGLRDRMVEAISKPDRDAFLERVVVRPKDAPDAVPRL